MEFCLQSIYYFIIGLINTLLSLPVTDGVSIGGVLFVVLFLSAIFTSFGFRGKS